MQYNFIFIAQYVDDNNVRIRFKEKYASVFCIKEKQDLNRVLIADIVRKLLSYVM